MFFSLIENRRSKRQFTDKKIAPETVEKLVEAALRSPSSRSINPWRFIVVDDPQMIEKLSLAKTHGSSFLKGAPLAFVVCADTTESDVWVEDTSIASIFIQLAAEALNLGSCWIQIRKRMHDSEVTAEAYVKELLDIPDNISVESFIAIGYPGETKSGHPKASLQVEKVFYGRYGQDKG
ncbi:MAG: NAD(P)H-dependent dehydrogenase/reductase [Desulfobacteraceae bacterium]|nr:MAG: NAD(P)H-dependent dehydrogenase/reductase [Desulfobacteraceae bacterium]